jgi:hypothetical protein
VSGLARGCIGCLVDEHDHSCGFVDDATQEQGIRLLSTRSTERSRVASVTSVPDADDGPRVPSTSEGEGA